MSNDPIPDPNRGIWATIAIRRGFSVFPVGTRRLHGNILPGVDRHEPALRLADLAKTEGTTGILPISPNARAQFPFAGSRLLAALAVVGLITFPNPRPMASTIPAQCHDSRFFGAVPIPDWQGLPASRNEDYTPGRVPSQTHY